ncbi:ATP-binding protein [Methylorubrum salsuginis]|uniref:histidine kinase n=1 Tax=Methylorubrum salsuginis TaxID=414703 RepID=A0A1I3YIB2_9HYPH|nr:ATP-binding protein [Methylorubrum salsuginis]SFK31011.1 Signal transduction histidine kinase [Methylorubrum salsuginis]
MSAPRGSAVAVPPAETAPRRRRSLPRRLPWPRPKSAAGQIALLVVAAMLAAHVLATVAVIALREPWRADGRPGVAATRLATVARLMDAAAPSERAAILRAGARTLPTLRIAPWDGEPPPAEAKGQVNGQANGPAQEQLIAHHPLVERLVDGFGRGLVLTDLAPEGHESGFLQLGLATPAGARLRATLPDDNPRPPIGQGALIFTFVFLGVSLLLLLFWATRALTAPLAGLAAAAEAFGTAEEAPPLPRRGPEEVLALARALDRMRARVLRLLDDRTQMLAAISHDLRTPITRLRLRAEFIEDERAREMTLRDLDQMNGLVESALSYVRDGQGGASEGEPTLIDLASVVQTVCDGFSDIGAAVSLERSRHVLVRGRPDDLQRALTNLVDNAVKYGGGARILMGPSGQGSRPGVAVEVLDDGPGIPEAERDAMLQPFVRGDRARNLNAATGFGLGLSIVLAIVEGHGGRLTLENREEGGKVVGLCARIELPLAASSRPAEGRSETV